MTNAHKSLWEWSPTKGSPQDEFAGYYISESERALMRYRKYNKLRKERNGAADRTTPLMLERIERIRVFLEENGPSTKAATIRAAGATRDEPLLTAATRELPLCEDDDGKLSLDKDARF